MTAALQRWLFRFGWLAVAGLVAAGSAGIVAGVDHLPGSARPELTWAADRSATPVLDDVAAGLDGLTGEVAGLGEIARRALAALPSRDAPAIEAAILAGDAQIVEIEGRVAGLEAALGEVPGIGPGADLRLAPAILERESRLRGALDATGRLPDAWAEIVNGGLQAARLVEDLETHDLEAAEAARLGTLGDYAAALERLTAAEAALRSATATRDRLRGTTDVSILDSWLERNASYDVVLRNLYVALLDSGGLANDEVRAAIAAEQAARQRLPPDTRGLVLILGEIGVSGMSQAVVTIEQVRGVLAAALSDG